MDKLHHRIKKHYRYHKQWIPHYFVILFYSAAIAIGVFTLFPPKVDALIQETVGLDQKISVSIWGWSNERSLTVISNFDTPLKARLEDGFYPIKRNLVIEPLDLLYPNTEYRFEIVSKNWLGLKTTKIVTIKTSDLPKVALSSNFPDKSQIAATSKFEFALDTNLESSSLSFSSNPPFEFSQELSGRKLTVQPKGKLLQGQAYQISLQLASQTLEGTLLYQDNFSVIDPLEIVSSTPLPNSDIVLKQTHLEFVFNKDVVPDGIDNLVLSEPKIDYTLSWKDSKSLVLTPVSLLKTATKYSISLSDKI
jgi:hypothetical protein